MSFLPENDPEAFMDKLDLLIRPTEGKKMTPRRFTVVTHLPERYPPKTSLVQQPVRDFCILRALYGV